jgi:peptide/nickel transport system ATP-binding protein
VRRVPLSAGSANGVDEPLLQVDGLTVQFQLGGVWTNIVEDLHLELMAHESLGIVGESGSGKSVSALACLGLIPAVGGRVVAGSVKLLGDEVLTMPRRKLDQVRGGVIGMVFQQPTRSLNPAFKVGNQLAETIRRHLGLNRRDAWERAVQMLDRVHLHNPRERAQQFPHQFSGGQAQRIMIAMALSCSPRILVADEPTTALDVTVEAKILDLLRELTEESGIARIMISHDLGMIAESCERVAVMYAGQFIEQGGTGEVLERPIHPYTRGLVRSTPRGDGSRLESIPRSIPQFDALPAGCRFHPRCHLVEESLCCSDPIPLERRGRADRLCRCARVPLTTSLVPPTPSIVPVAISNGARQ